MRHEVGVHRTYQVSRASQLEQGWTGQVPDRAHHSHLGILQRQPIAGLRRDVLICAANRLVSRKGLLGLRTGALRLGTGCLVIDESPDEQQ